MTKIDGTLNLFLPFHVLRASSVAQHMYCAATAVCLIPLRPTSCIWNSSFIYCSMSSPKQRKRKADALESGEDDDGKSPAAAPASDSPAHLPAPCLAAILNFLWYTDVRRCMLAGKIMAVEAARHVETLNITRSSELVVPAARRFTNVSEVNILCLVSEHDDQDYHILSRDAAIQTFPFIVSFPHLARVFIGGHYCDNGVWDKFDYRLEGEGGLEGLPGCRKPSDHEAIFRSLVQSLVGGFQSKSLKKTFSLRVLSITARHK